MPVVRTVGDIVKLMTDKFQPGNRVILVSPDTGIESFNPQQIVSENLMDENGDPVGIVGDGTPIGSEEGPVVSG